MFGSCTGEENGEDFSPLEDINLTPEEEETPKKAPKRKKPKKKKESKPASYWRGFSFPYSRGKEKLKVAVIVNDFLPSMENELEVRDGENVLVHHEDKKLGWMKCRKIGTHKREGIFMELDKVGYVPIDHFSTERKKSRWFYYLGKVKQKINDPDGVYYFAGHKFKDDSRYYCLKATSPFSQWNAAFFEPDDLEKVEFSDQLERKTERAPCLKSLLVKLPYRLIVEHIIGNHVLLEGVNEYRGMKQFFGYFGADKTRKIFCVFRNYSTCWSDVKKTVRVLPARFIQSLRLHVWSDEGGHVPCGMGSMTERPLPIDFWSKCSKIEYISKIVTKNRKNKKTIVSLSYFSKMKKLREIGDLDYDLATVPNISMELSQAKNLKSLRMTSFTHSFNENANYPPLKLELPNLTRLCVHFVNKEEGVILAGVKNLSDVEIQKITLRKDVVDELCDLPLKKIVFTDLAILNECDFYRLLILPSVETCEFKGKHRYGGEEKNKIPKEEILKLDLVHPFPKKFNRLAFTDFDMSGISNLFFERISRSETFSTLRLNYCCCSKKVIQVFEENQKLGSQLSLDLGEKGEYCSDKAFQKLEKRGKDLKNKNYSCYTTRW